MARVFNFAAGPSALPESVLAECAAEMLDYHGCGMSVLEMSHRSSSYQQIFDDAEATLRRIADIPSNYRVLFLQGGATLQFAGIPMNLMESGRAGYLVTGNFAAKAEREARKYGEVDVLATSEYTGFDRIPEVAGVGELAEAIGATQSAVSHQLRQLKQAHLVKFQRDGKSVIYSLSDDHVYTMLAQGMTHICE